MERGSSGNTKKSNGASVRPSQHLSRSVVYAPTHSPTEKNNVESSRRQPSSSRIGRLSSSMPPERSERVAEDSLEERIRKKLEKESPSQNFKPKKSGVESSTRSSGETFEERIRRKLEEDKASVNSRPKNDGLDPSVASVKKGSLGSSSRKSSRRGPLSSSMPPGFSCNSSGSTGLSLEERIQRKLGKNDAAKQEKDTEASSRQRALSSSASPGNSEQGVSSTSLSFEERMQRKLQEDAQSTKNKSRRATGPVSNSFPRPKLRTLSQPDIGSADKPREVHYLNKMNGRKKSKRFQRPLGMSSSLIHTHSGQGDLEKGSDTPENRMHSKTTGAKPSNFAANERNGATKFSEGAISESYDDTKMRMTRRSIRAGFNRSNAREITFDHNLGALREGLVVRSCSSSNLIPGSWECSFCTFVNESVSGVSIAVCKMCRNPHQAPLDEDCPKQRDSLVKSQNKSFKLQDIFDDNETPDNQLVESWSQLGDVLELAKHESSVGVGATNAVVTNQPLRPAINALDSWSDLVNVMELTKMVSIGDARARGNRRASDAETWFCDHCAHRNLDFYASFCGTCGKRRL